MSDFRLGDNADPLKTRYGFSLTDAMILPTAIAAKADMLVTGGAGRYEEVARDAGLLKTRYRFSLADAVILSTAIASKAEILLTGGDKQYENEWKEVTEIKVSKLSDFMK